MRSLKLTIAYDGTAYAGWQIQADTPTIQGQLEQALQRIAGQRVRTVASGRTDAGVHALGQVVSCQLDCRLTNDELRRALDANLPEDVSVLDVEDAPQRFHAIRDAVSKRYRYQIQYGPARNLFSRAYCWYLHQDLDVQAMQTAASHLIGTHDFASFQAAGSERTSTIRTVSALNVQPQADLPWSRLEIEITADGFLYNMVRNIVGTLVEIGKRKQPPDWIVSVLEAQDRTQAGPTAPPHGLFLVQVEY